MLVHDGSEGAGSRCGRVGNFMRLWPPGASVGCLERAFQTHLMSFLKAGTHLEPVPAAVTAGFWRDSVGFLAGFCGISANRDARVRWLAAGYSQCEVLQQAADCWRRLWQTAIRRPTISAVGEAGESEASMRPRDCVCSKDGGKAIGRQPTRCRGRRKRQTAFMAGSGSSVSGPAYCGSRLAVDIRDVRRI